jgi:hypothetical protein
MTDRHPPLFLLFLLVLATPALAQKNLVPPIFKPGDTSFYRVHLKIDRDIKTQSAFSIPEFPMAANLDVEGILQAEVLPASASASPPAIPQATRFRTWFLSLVSDIELLPKGSKSDGGFGQRVPAEDKFVDCTLLPSGEFTDISGLDQIAPEQQQAWREWATQFSAAFLIATQKRKSGEKWSSEEPETSPSPIADLRWKKTSHYVRDEPCTTLKFAAGAFQSTRSSNSCASISSAATLLQKSSPKDTTPPDYKQHDLHTSGTASGANDVLLSISRASGRLIRATQTAKQHMDVVILQTASSTLVHYNISATATSSVELISDLPLILQPKLSK